MQESVIHPRERIFNAAQKLFAARGYRGTAVQDIVETAGVTKPTLYYYYENKEGLYRTLVQEAFGRRLKLMEEAAARHEFVQDKLVAIMQTLLDFSREHSDLMRIAYANVFAPVEAVPDSIRGCKYGQRNWDFVHELIQGGMASGEITSRFDSVEITTAMYGQFFVAVSMMTMHPEKWQQQWGENLVRILFEGAGSRSPVPVGGVLPQAV